MLWYGTAPNLKSLRGLRVGMSAALALAILAAMCDSGPAEQRHGRGLHGPASPQALTSLLSWRGVFCRRRHGRHISIFDCYLRTPTGHWRAAITPIRL